MNKNTDEIPEVDILEEDTSFLFSLPPIAIGTPYVECLSSYVIRLAAAHCLAPITLLQRSVLEQVHKGSEIRRDTNGYHRASWHLYSQVLDGLTPQTEKWVDALQLLTQQTNLSLITMLPWSNVISGLGLIHRHAAWCPECLDEWQQHHSELYVPLLWRLALVTHCPIHQLPLESSCPYSDCSSRIPSISRNAQIGYCSICSRWLGSRCQHMSMREQNLDADAMFQLWATKQIGELLASAGQLDVRPSRAGLYDGIKSIMENITQGSAAQLARKVGLHRGTLRSDLAEKLRFSITPLIRICHVAGIQLTDLLTGTLPRLDQWKPLDRPPIMRENERIKAHIDAIIKEVAHPPLSLTTVAWQLGVPVGTLYYRFPAESKVISTRYKAHRRDTAQEILEAALIEEPPPFLWMVVNRAPCSRHFLRRHFPEQVKALNARANRKHLIITFEDLAILHHQLELALLENPPPSLRQVSVKTMYSTTLMKSHYPELYNRIAQRFRVWRLSNKVLDKPCNNNSTKSCGNTVADNAFSSAVADREAKKKQRAKEKLLSYLAMEPPPSLSRIADEIGYMPGTLRKHYPSECKLIVDIRHEYTMNRQAEKLDAMRKEIVRLHEQGVYPGYRQLRADFGRFMRAPKVLIEYRRLLAELGYTGKRAQSDEPSPVQEEE